MICRRRVHYRVEAGMIDRVGFRCTAANAVLFTGKGLQPLYRELTIEHIMNGLPFRHRFLCFLSIAAPALSAFLLGRLLTNCSRIFRSYYGTGDLPITIPAFTRMLLAIDTSGILNRAGGIAAIAIASIGFLLVHRLSQDRAIRAVLILVLIAWTIQMVLLMGSLVAFASPLANGI